MSEPNEFVCGEKPWTVGKEFETHWQILNDGVSLGVLFRNYTVPQKVAEAHNTVLARLTARIRELEEEIKTMEIER